MPLPDDWKKLSDLPKLTSAQLMAGDEVIMLTVGNKGARSELREIQSIIIDEAFNATQLPGGVGSNDTVIIKRGGDYFVATMNQVLGGVVSALEEYPTLGDFPTPGDGNTAYVALDTGVTYRWSGSTYVAVMTSLALGETDSTAYRGDRGKIAYDHVARSDNPHGVTAAQVGARPDNWIPTAAEVGAAPTNHEHTLADITDAGTAASRDVGTPDGLPSLAGSNNFTGNNTFTEPITAEEGLFLGSGSGDAIVRDAPPTSGGWAREIIRSQTATETMTFGVYGDGTDIRYMYIGEAFDNAPLKVDSQGRIGINLPTATRPASALDVGGTTRLRDLSGTGTRLVTASTSGYLGTTSYGVTVDGNGFIKQASPIVKLFNDHIEHEGFNQETPTMTKLDTGVYEITGTSGLAKRGWYIETPTDRNNDAYFNTEWEQTPYEVPVDENGQTPEPQNVTLLIKTFERVWDAGAGRFTNGAPIDIDAAAGPDRFIALRFTEVKPAEEEPEEEKEEE